MANTDLMQLLAGTVSPQSQLLEVMGQAPPEDQVAAPAKIPMAQGILTALADALQTYGRGLNPNIPAGNSLDKLRARRETQAQREATAQNQKRRQEFIAKQNKARMGLEQIDRAEGRAQQADQFEAGQAASLAAEERGSVRSAFQYAGTEGYDLSGVPKDASSEDYWRAIQVQSKTRREAAEMEGQKRMTAGEMSRLDDSEATIYDMLAQMEGGIRSIGDEEDPEAVRTNFTRTARRSLRKDPERLADVMVEFEATIGLAIDAEIEKRRVAEQKLTADAAKREGLGLLSSHAGLYNSQPESPGQATERLMRLLDRQTIGGAFKQ